MIPTATAADIAIFLAQHRNWQQVGDTLQRFIPCYNFKAAADLVARLAVLYEQQAHHPDTLLQYGGVTITTTTHDAGNKISQRDFALVAAIDAL